MATKTQFNDAQASRLYDLVEQDGSPLEIMQLAGINPDEAYTWTFESCSFVVAMRDRATIHEICFCPRGIDTWIEPRNPLFSFPEGGA